jgi:hypothetical protein
MSARAEREELGALAPAWAEAQLARSEPAVVELIARVRRGASSAELVTSDSNTMGSYLGAFQAVLASANDLSLSEPLEPSLEQIRTSLSTVMTKLFRSDPPSSERKGTYCCTQPDVEAQVVEGIADAVYCRQWHTYGAWAAAKCSALPLSSLHSGACDWGGRCTN